MRNHGTEMQYAPEDIPYLQKLIEKNPNPPPPRERIAEHPTGTNVGVIEAAMGAFAAQPSKLLWAHCCTGWGNQGLFYAWDATLRYADGVARVNLLLNRASPWMDIDSSLPYEGKVVVKNKTAKRVHLRIPLWVSKRDVRCRVGGTPVDGQWLNNYLIFENVKPGDQIVVEFPMVERTIQRSQVPGGTVYTIQMRGNTVMDISPRCDASRAVISDGALAVSRPSMLPVPTTRLKDERVSVDCSSGANCGILLRYTNDWNYLIAGFSAAERSIWFQEMVKGQKEPVQSVVRAMGPLGPNIHLTAEVNGSNVVFTVTDGKETLTTSYTIKNNNDPGEPGLIADGSGQRFDNFLVRRLDGTTIFDDRFERPNGPLADDDYWIRERVYRYYLRDSMRGDKAPMVKKLRFAPARTIVP